MKKVYSISGFWIFAIINLLFALKYLSRITEHYAIVTLAITFLYFLIWAFRVKIEQNLSRIPRFPMVLLLVFTAFAAVIWHLIPIESLKVDRWSVVDSFWNNWFRGDYVYYAQSFDHNHPGPMPFYFILALPFYWIGEQGFMALAGMFLFYYLLKKRGQQNTILLLLALSLFNVWEVCSRSNIFANATLILGSQVYFLQRYDRSLRSDLVFGLLFGLLLSTRNVFVIPYCIMMVYALRSGLITVKNLLRLGFMAVLIFVLTFVPFVTGHISDFWVMNPFIIQGSVLMPFEFTLVFILMAIVAGFLCRSAADVNLYAACVLFATILGYFGYICSKWGIQATFFDSKADVSYFILCVPFALYVLSEKRSAEN